MPPRTAPHSWRMATLCRFRARQAPDSKDWPLSSQPSRTRSVCFRHGTQMAPDHRSSRPWSKERALCRGHRGRVGGSARHRRLDRVPPPPGPGAGDPGLYGRGYGPGRLRGLGPPPFDRAAGVRRAPAPEVACPPDLAGAGRDAGPAAAGSSRPKGTSSPRIPAGTRMAGLRAYRGKWTTRGQPWTIRIRRACTVRCW